MQAETLKKSNIVIALCGMGASGIARQRAIAELSGISLAGIISRRPEVGTISLEAALQNLEIAAIAISTENTDHPGKVEQCLRAKKHVLCDFPLAMSGSEGRKLYNLAREKNRILHVEHLGLLSAEHLELKKQAAERGPLKKGEYLFQAGWNDKLADSKRTGPYPILAVSRLLQVADLFGPFSVASNEMRVDAQGFYLHLHLKFPEGGILGFTEERRVGLPRKRSLLAECETGSLSLKANAFSQGLFAKDLAWFRDRVLAGKACYYDEELMLGVLDEIEKISI
jgi:biliverdin reductase